MEVRALSIGINAYQSVSSLRGCINDAQHLGVYLKETVATSARLVTDRRADRLALLERLDWVTDVPYGGHYIITFSGHGTRVRDWNGDELDDHLDECICPFDSKPSTYWDDGMIKDDEWMDILPRHASGTIILDCCHAGTGVRDLDSDTSNAIKDRFIEPPIDVTFRHDATIPRSGVQAVIKEFDRPVAFFGASQDNQTAADYREPNCQVCLTNQEILRKAGSPNGYHGALSFAILSYLWKRGKDLPTNEELAQAVQKHLKENNFSQVPTAEFLGGVSPSARLFSPLP